MIFAAILFALLTARGYSETCDSKPDGNYEVSCRSYVVCQGGVPTLVHCPDPPALNTTYNPATGQCDRPENVGPPCGDWRDCSNMADGSYPDLYTNCTSYFTCHGGHFFGHNFCSPGLVFDSAIGTCNWPSQVAPPCGTFVPTLH